MPYSEATMPGPARTMGKATTKPSFSLATNQSASATPHMTPEASAGSATCGRYALQVANPSKLACN